MEASRTVEDYLKAIYLAESTLASPSDLVPMGQIASAVGVVPGTATSMVKALADSGLVRYEPYMGVRLTTAGLRLAGRVLRRHGLGGSAHRSRTARARGIRSHHRSH
jgi:DtxR family Mn-dependent transcriptional regulator